MPHYSHSRLGVHSRCPRQERYIYVDGRRRPPAGAMLAGSAAHASQEAHVKDVIAGGSGLELSAYEAKASDYFDAHAPEVEWDKEDDPAGKVKDKAVRLASAHRTLIVPKFVNPIASEEQIDVSFGSTDWTLRCVLDVVHRLDSGKVALRDLKTKGKAPSGIKSGKVEVDSAHRSQLHAYYLAWKQAHGDDTELAVDYVWSGAKSADALTVAVDFSGHELALLLEDLDEMDSMNKAGLYPRRRDGWWCSVKTCGFYDECIGTVGVDR